jgi:hypothetical protein
MGDNGAGHPAARAYHQPPSRESSVSGAKLVSPRPGAASVPPATSGVVSVPPATSGVVSVPPTASGAVAIAREDSARFASNPPHALHGADWGKLATAPTLLLTPSDGPGPDDAASTSRIEIPSAANLDELDSTSRIETVSAPLEDWASTARIATTSNAPPAQANGAAVTPSMMPPGDPAWFRSGNTLPPPSMRPMAESLSPPAARTPPNPRVMRIVGGVIAVCLFIVAIAGIKILSQRSRAPASPNAESKTSNAATVEPPAAPRVAAPVEPPPAAPAPEANNVAASATAVPAAVAPARTTNRATPARATAKPATHRAPVTKKVGRNGH